MIRSFLFTITVVLSTFTISGQSWQQLGDTPFGGHHSNGFGYEGKAYIMQGEPNTSGSDFDTNNYWEYDPIFDTWTKLGIMPGGARSFAIGDNWEDKYYFGFGVNGNEYYNDLWVFDPADQSFTELPSCPCIGRAHPALIAHNDKIMMGTGSSSIGDLEDWWEYDMITQVWTQKENMPGGDRHHPFFFGIDNKVYAGGGHLRNWLSYDLETEEWVEIDNEPDGRVAGSQLNHKNYGYLIGGDDRFHATIPVDESFMRFDPVSGEWEKLPPLPEGSRWAPSSFIIDDQLFFFGGELLGTTDFTMYTFDLDHLNCLPADNLNAINITENTADLFWISSDDATSDTLLWRKVGETEWNRVSNPQAIFTLDNLEGCSAYEYTLSTACDTLSSTAFRYNFRTLGCGSCVDAEYCNISNGLSGYSYIDAVQINNFSNVSGDNDGYGEFTLEDNSQIFFIGQSFDLTVIPGFTGNPLVLNLMVWVDFNANGEFEESEKVVDELDVDGGYAQSINIPGDAVEGITRMRILYAFDGVIEPCAESSLTFGEAEDYCMDLRMFSSTSDLDLKENNFSIYPNPFSNQFTIVSALEADQNYQLTVRNLMGETVAQFTNHSLKESINLPDLVSGIYLVEIMDESKARQVVKLMKH